MSYLVLARKYRSQSFSEIVAQEHVTQTLQNAILAGRLAHAILFCGPRGTGKTSIARILAKAMNCAQGPSPTPCNQCRSCREITAGNGVDVMEIDGASNNSVDQVRDLRDSLGYMPAHSRHRIYIIDEVHMLSTAAFNALLKTLEEPPAHVLFFFATTEPHKIPLTILSRCQRHDLRRVGTQALTAHLSSLCQAESVFMEEEALDMIAREADGSVRDSLSLLDRVISSLEGEPGTPDKVARILGLAARSRAFQIADALFRGDTARVLSIIRDLHDAGVDLRKFHGDLATHIRNLLIAKVAPKGCAEFLDLPDALLRDLLTQAAPLTEHYLSRLLDLLMGEDAGMRHASHPRLAMETMLLRCLRIQPALSIDRLVERLEALRQDILSSPESSGEAPSPGPEAMAPVAAPPSSAPLLPEKPQPPFLAPFPAEKPKPHSAPPLATPAPQSVPPSMGKTREPLPMDMHFTDDNTEVPDHYKPMEPKTPSPAQPPTAPARQAGLQRDGKTDTPIRHSPPEKDSRQSAQAPPLSLPSARGQEKLWATLIARLRQASPSLGELFATKTALKKLSDQSIEIEVQGSGFSMARFTHEKTRQLVETLAAEIFGRSLSLVIRATEEKDSVVLRSQSEKELLRNDATTHALVQDALEIFKGRVADVTFLKEAQ
jgi:DNA polymerase-3 subunit gamma/tau